MIIEKTSPTWRSFFLHNMENITIKKWDEGDRPREKFISKGGENLSTSELLAIIIGSGTKEYNAIDLARQILNWSGGSLLKLKGCSISDLKKFKGIGDKKAVEVMTIFELFRRMEMEKKEPVIQICSSSNVYNIMAPIMKDLKHEECWVLFLNKANRLIHKEKVSSGGVSSTVLDTKMIIKKAIERLSSAIILTHNHPSGALSPGQQDRKQTHRLKEATKMCDIILLDHIIISSEGYFSFADSGVL